MPHHIPVGLNNGETLSSLDSCNLPVSDEVSFLVARVRLAVQFMALKTGLKVVPDAYSGQEIPKVVLADECGPRLLVTAFGGKPPRVIFHSTDCIRDYHQFILSGIEFTSRPGYNGNGLSVGFIDDDSNIYELLEERDYTEI